MEPENHTNGQESNRLLQAMESPWKILKEGAKYGINGTKNIIGILLLFGFTNMILFFYALFTLLAGEFVSNNLWLTLLNFVLGWVFTFIAAYMAYRYVLIEILKIVYSNLAPELQKICFRMVDLFKAGTETNKAHIGTLVNTGKILDEQFSKSPKLVKKGLGLLLKRVPFAEMLGEVKQVIMDGDREKASTLLFTKTDAFIRDSVLGNNTKRWVYWLLPLNIMVQMIIVEFMV